MILPVTATRRRAAILVLLAAAGWFAASYLGPSPDNATPRVAGAVDNVVADAYANRRSGIWITVNAKVTRLLPDDADGSRHQRFIVTLNDGHTVLVSHNIDLAPRVALQVDDDVQLHGRYEYNERGGVLHWTHHDPGGNLEGGWIEHGGRRYR